MPEEISSNCQKPKRHYWLDLARATAILSVTMNHALSRSFLTRENAYSEFLEMSAAGSFLKALLYACSRLGVPLFLMITGSLLMYRDYEDTKTFKRFFHHNFGSLFVATELWLFIQFWFLQFFEDSILRTKGFFTALIRCVGTLCLINTTEMTNMWYMWMILPVYLMIPVMSLGVKKLGDKLFFILAAIAVTANILIPNINTILYVAGQEKYLDFAISARDLFSQYFVFVFIGYWITRGKLQKICNTLLLSVFIVGLVATSLFQYWMYSNGSNYYIAYNDIGVLIVSASLFELIRRSASAFRKLKRPVTFLARSAFAIFFLHLIIMHTIIMLIGKEIIYRFPRFLLLESFSLIGSCLIVWIGARISFVRHRMFLIRN